MARREAQKGRFKVETEPAGASVTAYYGGSDHFLGASPTEPVERPAGDWVGVQVRLDGYDGDAMEFAIEPNVTQTIRFRLKEKKPPAPRPRAPREETPTPPVAPPRQGHESITSITVSNLENRKLRVVVVNETNFTVVDRVVDANAKQVKLAGNIGRSFSYLLEASNKGYMGNLSSDDICVGQDALPIQFPGAAARKVKLMIVGYSSRPAVPVEA